LSPTNQRQRSRCCGRTCWHDPEAFTEGLELHGDTLYEGTRLEGQSQLREVDPTMDTVRRAAKLPDHLFGEGISVVGDRIWQLT
jgi:glutamine cyclotransferase